MKSKNSIWLKIIPDANDHENEIAQIIIKTLEDGKFSYVINEGGVLSALFEDIQGYEEYMHGMLYAITSIAMHLRTGDDKYLIKFQKFIEELKENPETEHKTLQ